MTDTIKHNGTVEHIEGNHITVRILQTSACSSCRVKTFCSSAESKEKLIDVYYDGASPLQIGQEVMLCGSSALGMKAVLWAFVLPFFILIASLFIAYSITGGNEAFAALISLLMLCPYYLILYVLRNKMMREFSFTLKLINY